LQVDYYFQNFVKKFDQYCTFCPEKTRSLTFFLSKISVFNRYSFDPDPDPVFQSEYRSGSLALMTKNRKKFAAEKKIFFDPKLQFAYPLAQATEEALSP
jgi:hypothetical protein